MFLKQDVLSNMPPFNDIRILTVDNDHDTGALYTTLFENCDVTVVTAESIHQALELLNESQPDILICEARFLGESVDPLIQKVKSIAQDKHKLIPIFVTSTCPAMHLVQYLKTSVEAYHIKPVDLDHFVAEVWKLTLLSRITYPPNYYTWLAKLGIDETSYCCKKVG